MLSIAGLAGVVLDDMVVRNIGIVGYAVVFPVAAVLIARMFAVGTPSRTGTEVNGGARVRSGRSPTV